MTRRTQRDRGQVWGPPHSWLAAMVLALATPLMCAGLDGTFASTSNGAAQIRLLVTRRMEPSFTAGRFGREICVRSNDGDTVFDVVIPRKGIPARRVAETRVADSFRSGRCAPLPRSALPRLESDESVVLFFPAT